MRWKFPKNRNDDNMRPNNNDNEVLNTERITGSQKNVKQTNKPNDLICNIQTQNQFQAINTENDYFNNHYDSMSVDPYNGHEYEEGEKNYNEYHDCDYSRNKFCADNYNKHEINNSWDEDEDDDYETWSTEIQKNNGQTNQQNKNRY